MSGELRKMTTEEAITFVRAYFGEVATPSRRLIGAAGSSPKPAVEVLREDRSVQLAAEDDA